MEKTIQQQYDLIKEGKGNKDDFLKSARRVFPELITPGNDYNTAVHILKSKSILSEGTSTVTDDKNWFKIFETNLKEAVGVKDTKEYGDQNTFEKIDKDVKAALDHQFDNKDPKNIDNVYGQSFLIGYLAEMDDPKNSKKTVDELKAIVAKNMAKDINYYAKNGMFSVKGIGLETSKESKPPKGKFKSSGYGDLKEGMKPKKTISIEDNEELNNYFSKPVDEGGDGDDYVPFDVTGKTYVEAAKQLGDNYWKEYLEHIKYILDNIQEDNKKLDSFKEGINKDNNFDLKGKFKSSGYGDLKESKLRSLIRNLINEELN